jgi:hypothetical protein
METKGKYCGMCLSSQERLQFRLAWAKKEDLISEITRAKREASFKQLSACLSSAKP